MYRFLPAGDWMHERGLNIEELERLSQLERKIVEAIVCGRYTPSLEQKQKMAAALGVDIEQVMWGHTCQVEHIHGHGPQFGRSP